MGIHDDAWQGILHGDILDNYYRSNPDSINDLDPAKGISPLIAAIMQGHVRVVEELLKKGAQADRRSIRGEPPLLLAWRAKKNRARIIQLLLEKIPAESVDATCDYAENNTPLMQIINETRPIDVESVRLLRNAGASLTVENDAKYNAEQLARRAEDSKLVSSLYPNKERFEVGKLVDMVVSFLLFIIASLNKLSLRGIINGVVRRLYGLNPALDPSLHRAVNSTEPQDKEELLENIDSYVSSSPMRKSFPPGSLFLQEVDSYRNLPRKLRN